MIEIIPAIDIIDGKCVRLSQGDYGKKREYSVAPAEMVKMFLDYGLTRIHAVDLDGAKAGKPINLRSLESMASVGNARIEWGGGLKSEANLKDSLNAGATYLVAGSVAAREPDRFARWLDIYGADCMILGADVRQGKIAVGGWLETEEMSVDDLIDRFSPCGLTQAIVTDISRDGMLEGPSFELYSRLQQKYPDTVFTVSGGISSFHDILQLEKAGMKRVIVGKAIYEGHVSLKDVESYIAGQC